MPGQAVPQYGDKRTNRIGLAVTVLLHLLLVALYFYQPPRSKEKPAAAAREGEVVYVAPLSTPTPPAPKPSTPSKPRKSSVAPPPPRVARLPNTITLPDEPPAPVAKAEPKPEPEPVAPPRPEVEPGMDMAAAIAKRREQRGAPADKPAEETEAQRGTRNALANIAGINRRARDAGSDDGEGRATITFRDRTFHSMTIDMRLYNPNFGRNWLTTFTVEQNNAPDVETAVVDHMVQVLRRTMAKDFRYTLRNGKEIPMSNRPEDIERLRDVLFRDMFPEYKRMPR